MGSQLSASIDDQMLRFSINKRLPTADVSLRQTSQQEVFCDTIYEICVRPKLRPEPY